MPQKSIVLQDIAENVQHGMLNMDFLLPNGILIPKRVEFDAPLEILKQLIYKDAEGYPLFDKLQGADSYFFVFLNKDGQKEEVTDESLCLSEIRPIATFLKLQERHRESSHKTVDRQITNLIGSRIIMDIHSQPRSEVDDFKRRMLQYLENVLREEPVPAFEKKYPLCLRSSYNLPQDLRQKTEQTMLVVPVKIQETAASFKIKVSLDDTPIMVMNNALKKWHNQPQHKTSMNYVLKAFGIEDYLYGTEPIHRFKYVYSCLQRNVAPGFWLINSDKLFVEDTPKKITHPRGTIAPQSHKDISVFDIKEMFSLKVSAITNIEVTTENTRENIEKVKLFVALYHGNEVLGDVSITTEKSVVGGNCTFNTTSNFELEVADIQHSARLCFTLHGRMKGNRSIEPIAWVNVPVYDFRSRLVTGERKFRMWPLLPDMHLEETGCFPLGTVSLNPHTSITLAVEFPDYRKNKRIMYPTDAMITECAADNMEEAGMPGHPHWKANDSQIEKLHEIVRRDHSAEGLHEQDKELCWLMRYYCREDIPEALPHVLNSVKWYNHIDVAQMQVLLNTWQKLPVDHALELLDFNFPDQYVRQYAVSCMEILSDDELSLYLLQLVQALKYETYLFCPLSKFLLKRAIQNQNIGQQLFWLLKAELHNATVSMRFSLILDVYLRICTDHMHTLHQQHEALNKLHTLSQLVKPGKFKDDKSSKDKQKGSQKDTLQAVLKQKSYRDKLTNFISPLCSHHRLGELMVEGCKVMDSKKRPLYLVWSNGDEEGPEVHIIYKNGDDLRQDMLTLQMLQVMDSIWQDVGLDLRMNVYGCMASGLEQGMIEVVRFSKTINNIQTEANKVLDRKTLYDWLKQRNPTEKALELAVEEFILSCAGYTVATYVLGIGDRHNDNIMLKETGQLFHIDFGHFLGNFKSKYGIKRERVPFVLTNHFVYVITNGEKTPKNYERFVKYCLEAYLALRKRGPLLIRLFMMMLSSGIPQLSTVSDLEYLKDTLALRHSDDMAIEKFKKELDKAANSLSVLINWVIHNVAHN